MSSCSRSRPLQPCGHAGHWLKPTSPSLGASLLSRLTYLHEEIQQIRLSHKNVVVLFTSSRSHFFLMYLLMRNRVAL